MGIISRFNTQDRPEKGLPVVSRYIRRCLDTLDNKLVDIITASGTVEIFTVFGQVKNIERYRKYKYVIKVHGLIRRIVSKL